MTKQDKGILEEEMVNSADIMANASDVFKKAVSEMIMTTVKHKGKVRSWKGLIGNWEKHSDVIKEWCDGADIEILDVDDDWTKVKSPAFLGCIQYRVAQPPKKHGAIYSDDDCCIYVYHNTEGKIRFPDVFYSEPNKYLAPSTAAYHARMFLERCDDKTDQETVAYLAEQCRYGE